MLKSLWSLNFNKSFSFIRLNHSFRTKLSILIGIHMNLRSFTCVIGCVHIHTLGWYDSLHVHMLVCGFMIRKLHKTAPHHVDACLGCPIDTNAHFFEPPKYSHPVQLSNNLWKTSYRWTGLGCLILHLVGHIDLHGVMFQFLGL